VGQHEGAPVTAPDGAYVADSESGQTAKRGASATKHWRKPISRHLHQPQEMRALDELMRGFAIRLRKLTLRRETAGGSRRIDIPGTARRSVSHVASPLSWSSDSVARHPHGSCCCSMSAAR